MTTVTDSSARALDGRLCLRFARSGDRTVLASAERTPPLHVQRLLYLDPRNSDLAHAVLLNATAGLFAGDRLTTSIDVEPGAAVAVNTPTMARLYAMREGCAHTITRLAVAGDGYLEYLPEPAILCGGAALHAALEIDAGPDALVAVGEVFAFGRVARGELHAYRELVARTTVRVGGETVITERLSLCPARDNVAFVVGRYAAYGCVHLLGPGVAGMLGVVRTELDAHADLLGGASLLPGDAGIAVRVLGSVPHAVQASLRTVLRGFRCAMRLPTAHGH